jgi:hypothetical protein
MDIVVALHCTPPLDGLHRHRVTSPLALVVVVAAAVAAAAAAECQKPKRDKENELMTIKLTCIIG